MHALIKRNRVENEKIKHEKKTTGNRGLYLDPQKAHTRQRS